MTSGEHLVDASGKMVVLDKLLHRLKAAGAVALISNFGIAIDLPVDF